ncbi:adenylyl-sulfate kinase [Endothiovibrio diazotrophicus]
MDPHPAGEAVRSAVLWFTGLSGSGKSTIAHALETRLHQLGSPSYVLDCENVREGLCRDLGYSPEDRHENIRRIGEMSRLLLDTGTTVLAAFISPFREDRAKLRRLFGRGNFVEIYCRCPLDVCEQRDPKGIYAQARAGEVSDYTGVTSPYEEPEEPELILDTGLFSAEESVERIVLFLEEHGYLPRKRLSS